MALRRAGEGEANPDEGGHGEVDGRGRPSVWRALPRDAAILLRILACAHHAALKHSFPVAHCQQDPSHTTRRALFGQLDQRMWERAVKGTLSTGFCDAAQGPCVVRRATHPAHLAGQRCGGAAWGPCPGRTWRAAAGTGSPGGCPAQWRPSRHDTWRTSSNQYSIAQGLANGGVATD